MEEFNKALKDAEKHDQKQKYSRYDSNKHSDRYKHGHDHNDRHETNKKRLHFRKPDEDSFEGSEKSYKTYDSQSSRRNWRKPTSNTSSLKDTEV